MNNIKFIHNSIASIYDNADFSIQTAKLKTTLYIKYFHNF